MSLIPLSIGGGGLGLFIWRQLIWKNPCWSCGLEISMFTLNTLLGMAVFVAMIGGMIILPLFMQNMAGFTATDSDPCSCLARYYGNYKQVPGHF